MARPAKTDAQRAAEVSAIADALPALIAAAAAAPASTPAEKLAAWGPVADAAGQLQRRTRLLAGMKRGG